ncbi:hypothetical protein SESBI_12863 [Sesbania bispinosa]|nr:hypothetical protein SESBI_12863 [Sesbania bispinosa]
MKRGTQRSKDHQLTLKKLAPDSNLNKHRHSTSAYTNGAFYQTLYTTSTVDPFAIHCF